MVKRICFFTDLSVQQVSPTLGNKIKVRKTVLLHLFCLICLAPLAKIAIFFQSKNEKKGPLIEK